MKQLDPGKEMKNIVETVSAEQEATVDKIHRALAKSDDSGFSEYGETKSEERRLVGQILYYLRNRLGVVTNDGQYWTLSDAAGNISIDSELPVLDMESEHTNILRALDKTPQSTLGEIHEELVSMPRSAFHTLPAQGWNEERRILIALRDSLRENHGLITNQEDQNNRTWSLTAAGEQHLEERRE